MSIKDLDQSLKPREKAIRYGLEKLSDVELLAILIKNGTKGKSCLDLAAEMIDSNKGLSSLMELSVQQLTAYKGIGLAKAIEIMASIELVKRISYQKVLDDDVIACPNNLIEWLKKYIGKQNQEYFVVVFLDNRNRVIHHSSLYKGTVNQISISARDIFNQALKYNTSKIIVAHNHPSQNVSPSKSDDNTTMNLYKASKLLNIELVDHIIVSYDNYYSYKENQII